MPSILPGLWIVATPLGNLEDFSPFARKCLLQADLVLAEDTRRASWLLRNLDLKVNALESLHEHNESSRLSGILAKLQEGKKIALISDAGTPLLSDPGYRLVRACRMHSIPVHPVPGPSAPVAALSAAGLPPIPYSFLGFLPRDAAGIEKIFRSFQRTPGSLVFFERKDRLQKSLKLALDILGNREIAICREMTKTHEEFILGNLFGLISNMPELLGEITVILGPADKNEKIPRVEVEKLLESRLEAGVKLREAVNSVIDSCPGWSGSELYKLARDLRKSND